MAKLEGNFEFTGSLGGVTAYRMKGCDHIVLRRTAGPSKNQVKNGSNFVRTRENYQEFGGVAKAAKHFRQALSWLHRLADFNFQPKLNKVTKAIQRNDQISGRGKRNILYSQNYEMLKGFDLNKYHQFDSIVRKPVTCTINSETCAAVVTIPSLQRGINLNLPWPTPQFRFIVSLGVCDDLLFQEGEYREHNMSDPQASTVETAWQRADAPYAGEALTIQLPYPGLLQDQSSLVVAIGIEFDMSHRVFGNERAQRSLSGSAKILDLARATPTPQPTLELPKTIRIPEPAELEESADMQELLQQREQAQIREGFELQVNETPEQPDAFYAAINVNHSRLWDVFMQLAAGFSKGEMSCIISVEGEAPVTTGSFPKQQMLTELRKYRLELTNDTSLSFGLLLQTEDAMIKLWVTKSKYIQYWGINQTMFEKQMRMRGIRSVPGLEFVDAYPMVTEPLHTFYPGARDARTVVKKLLKTLGES